MKLNSIFHAPVADAVCRPLSDEESAGRKVLTFATPQVLLIDPWNGPGHETAIPASITCTLSRPEEGDEAADTARVYLDSDTSGYSWDAVRRLNKGAYRRWAPAACWID
ncbi:hypothetical protein [Arthrobacter sp. N1]|uniref:hypothetical protein n=1 Tax=Arthrobacter sp. N1 TaxID=619291 RepID=UPI003BB07C35